MNIKSDRGGLIKDVVESITKDNIFNTEIELKDSLQKELNTKLTFKTTVSDFETKNGFNFGKVLFVNENDIKSILDVTIQPHHRQGLR